jgi:hypothetical protein
MALILAPRITLVASLFAVALSLTVKAQAPGPNQTEWENEALNLRLFYPSDLVKADAAQVMHDGNVTLFGISAASDPKLAEATHCLRPILLLELPQSPSKSNVKVEPGVEGATTMTATHDVSATILLAELDTDCFTSEQEIKSTTPVADLAEVVNKVPGMKPIAQPAWYTVGWQKVHMAAAQGRPQAQAQTQAQTVDPSNTHLSGELQLYTMGLSTNWNNHLLVWYFSSNSIDTLNRITKTTVRFGRAQAAPLYPVPMGNASSK